MRSILRRREVVADDWRYWGETGSEAAASGESVALIVPLAEFLTNITRWRDHAGRVGVRLSPPDAVEQLTEDIHRLDLVAVEFPGPGDGRGQGRRRSGGAV